MRSVIPATVKPAFKTAAWQAHTREKAYRVESAAQLAGKVMAGTRITPDEALLHFLRREKEPLDVKRLKYFLESFPEYLDALDATRRDQCEVLRRCVAEDRVVQPESVDKMQHLGTLQTADDCRTLARRSLLQENPRLHEQGIGRQLAALDFFGRHRRQRG